MLIQLVVSVPTMYNAFIFCTTTTAISFFYISICDNVLFSPIFHPIFARFCYRREDDLADSACYKRLRRKRYWAFPRKVCVRLRFWVLLDDLQGSSNCLVPVRRKIVILTEVCSYPKLMLPCMPLSNYISSIFPSNSTYTFLK